MEIQIPFYGKPGTSSCRPVQATILLEQYSRALSSLQRMQALPVTRFALFLQPRFECA